MASTKKHYIEVVKPVSVYILESNAILDRTSTTYYKIGEADNDRRPADLCNTYTKNTKKINATTTKIAMIELPHDNSKRLNDIKLRELLEATGKMHAVYKFLIEGMYNETDGYNEFMEAPGMTPAEVIELVKETIAKATAKDYTVKNKVLKVDAEKFADKDADGQSKACQAVSTKIINAKKLPGVIMARRSYSERFAYRKACVQSILLAWTLVQTNLFPSLKKMTVLVTGNDKINNATLYNIMKAEPEIYEIIELESDAEVLKYYMETMEKDYDLVISNPPYGAIGAEITWNIINNIDYDLFYNLLPAKDYTKLGKDSLALTNHIVGELDVYAQAFDGDADVITHLAEISKDSLNRFNSIKEYEAATFATEMTGVWGKIVKANYTYSAEFHSWSDKDNVSTSVVYHSFCFGSAHTYGLPKVDTVCIGNLYNYNDRVIRTQTEAVAAGCAKSSLEGGSFRVTNYKTPEGKANAVRFQKENPNLYNIAILVSIVGTKSAEAGYLNFPFDDRYPTREDFIKTVSHGALTDDEVRVALEIANKFTFSMYVKEDFAQLQQLIKEVK